MTCALFGSMILRIIHTIILCFRVFPGIPGVCTNCDRHRSDRFDPFDIVQRASDAACSRDREPVSRRALLRDKLRMIVPNISILLFFFLFCKKYTQELPREIY